MTIAQSIAQKVEMLSPQQQQKALELIESLGNNPEAHPAPRGLRGMLRGKIPQISLQDFQTARREIWASLSSSTRD